MNFTTIGSLGTYLKTSRLQMQWKLRENQSDNENKNTDPITSILDRYAENQPDDIMQTIRTKISSGKKLTEEERSYLQQNDPITYEKVRSMEMERKGYESALKRCETKEDVQRLKMTYMNASLASVKNIASNSSIPKGKKMELLAMENARMNGIEAATRTFINKAGRSLPTDAEKHQAEEMVKAEQEIQQTPDTAKEPDTGKQEPEIKTQEPAKQENNPAPVDAADLRQAADTPEIRKLRHAKAKRQTPCTPDAASTETYHFSGRHNHHLDVQI